MKLSKEVCEWCCRREFGRSGMVMAEKEWTEAWGSGTAVCMRAYKSFRRTGGFVLVGSGKGVPVACPYRLEHVLESGG